MAPIRTNGTVAAVMDPAAMSGGEWSSQFAGVWHWISGFAMLGFGIAGMALALVLFAVELVLWAMDLFEIDASSGAGQGPGESSGDTGFTSWKLIRFAADLMTEGACRIVVFEL